MGCISSSRQRCGHLWSGEGIRFIQTPQAMFSRVIGAKRQVVAVGFPQDTSMPCHFPQLILFLTEKLPRTSGRREFPASFPATTDLCLGSGTGSNTKVFSSPSPRENSFWSYSSIKSNASWSVTDGERASCLSPRLTHEHIV
jgi:hypothetical protein